MLRARKSQGWTLLELLAAMTVSGILATVAYGSYSGVLERTKVNQAIVDIAKIHGAIEKYRLNNNKLPVGLATVGMDLKDPWGRAYAYLDFSTLPAGNKAPVRKDRNLVPLNSKYDLYSRGKDGNSLPPLTAPPSHDDIILANDGAFMGSAADY
jgi:general secretion pathway protein G